MDVTLTNCLKHKVMVDDQCVVFFYRANPAFNKEVFVDLMAAQIKTLSFLAYIVRMYQEMVAQHSNLMVKGLLGMLTICPMEVTHLRKELLIASRHILATDLRVSEYCHKTHFK